MEIHFNNDLWNSSWSKEIQNAQAPFAPITGIRLWQRREDDITHYGEFAIHEYHCLYFCLSGSGSIMIDGISHHLGPSEAIGVLPRHPHQRLNEDTPVHYLLIRFKTSHPDFVHPLFGANLKVHKSLYPYIQNVVDSWEKLLGKRTDADENELGLNLAFLLSKMISCRRKPLYDSGAWSNKHIQQALQLLMQAENMNVPIGDIAKKMGISPGHLSDIIHDHIGSSPSAIKRNMRFQIAVDELVHSSLSVSQIAEHAGFKSIYAFSRFFRNLTHQSPLSFRKKYAKKAPED